MKSDASARLPSSRTGSTHTLPLMKLATNTCLRRWSTRTWQGSVPCVSCRLRNASLPVVASTANALTVPVGLPSKVLSSFTAYRNRPVASNARYDGLVTPVVLPTSSSPPEDESRR